MPESIQDSLPTITAILLGLALLSFLVSLRLFRRSRRDVFWRRRREAGQRGWRLFLLSITLLVVGTVSCAMTLAVSMISDDDGDSTPTVIAVDAGQTPTPTLLPARTGTDGPVLTPPQELTQTPLDTPQLPVTETPTQVATVIIVVTTTPVVEPSLTPFATFTPVETPLVSSVTPDPDAYLAITALDDQISDALAPVNPRISFDAGTTRIYFFVEFENMTPGLLWRRALYRDGELLDSGSYLWGSEIEGESYFFFGNDNGFPPGEYEIRLFFGEESAPANSMRFSIDEKS
jgi:hypothetical protein